MTSEERYLNNEKLVFGYLNTFRPDLSHDEDYIQLAKMGLWLACLNYDEERDTAFSSFAYKVIDNEFNKEFVRLYSQKRRINLSTRNLEDPIKDVDSKCLMDILSNPLEGQDRFEEILAAEQSLDYLYKFMTPKQLKCVKTWMACDCNNIKAAEILGVSHQAVSEVIKNIGKRLAYMKHKIYLV